MVRRVVGQVLRAYRKASDNRKTRWVRASDRYESHHRGTEPPGPATAPGREVSLR
ncbi:MAG: hypothetical protein ACMUIA_09880 [bacterium]